MTLLLTMLIAFQNTTYALSDTTWAKLEKESLKITSFDKRHSLSKITFTTENTSENTETPIDEYQYEATYTPDIADNRKHSCHIQFKESFINSNILSNGTVNIIFERKYPKANWWIDRLAKNIIIGDYDTSSYTFTTRIHSLDIPSATLDCKNCQKIKTISLHIIRNKIARTQTKENSDSVELDSLFEKLKSGQLEEHMKKLKEIPAGTPECCLSLVDLIDEERFHNRAGFGTREYTLNEEIIKHLNPRIERLFALLNNDPQLYQVDIVATGFCDKRKFKSIPLDTGLRGFVYWNNNYCWHEDSLITSHADLAKDLIPFSETALENDSFPDTSYIHENVPDMMTLNCQLSAVRAYQILKYIKQRIETKKNIKKTKNNIINYYYIGGGLATDVNDDNLDAQRKYHLSIKVKYAKDYTEH